VQHSSAGDQNLEARSSQQQPLDIGPGINDLLKVIQHHEHGLVSQAIPESLPQRVPVLRRHPKDLRDGRDNPGWVDHRG
jgi:hypothetical protein